MKVFNFRVGQVYETLSGSQERVTGMGIHNNKQWVFIGNDSGGNYYNEFGKTSDSMSHMNLVSLIEDVEITFCPCCKK